MDEFFISDIVLLNSFAERSGANASAARASATSRPVRPFREPVATLSLGPLAMRNTGDIHPKCWTTPLPRSLRPYLPGLSRGSRGQHERPTGGPQRRRI